MNAYEIIQIVEGYGASLKADGDMLEVVNWQQLPPDTVNLLKQHKPDLLAHLSHAGSAYIEPLDHINDANFITPKERLKERAILAVQRLHERSVANLLKGGYAIDNAAVQRIEWRHVVMKRLQLSSLDMDKLEHELIQEGRLAYEGNHSYLILGDGVPIPAKDKNNPDFILDNDTGSTFLNWLYH